MYEYPFRGRAGSKKEVPPPSCPRQYAIVFLVSWLNLLNHEIEDPRRVTSLITRHTRSYGTQ